MPKDHGQYFNDLIAAYLDRQVSRSEVADKVAKEIGIDQIQGDHHNLLTNIEHALRHVANEQTATTDAELRYYLECLNGHRDFDEQDRDRAISGGT